MKNIARGGSRTAAASKMEPFVIIVNGFQPLTIIKNSSILDAAGILDPPLIPFSKFGGSFDYLPNNLPTNLPCSIKTVRDRDVNSSSI